MGWDSSWTLDGLDRESGLGSKSGGGKHRC